MQINIYRLLFLLTWSLSFPPTQAQEADTKHARVALVIGNNRYESAVGPLRNAVNDAKAMAKTLRAIGFTVIEKHNVTRHELLTLMLRFQTQLRGAEVGVFYFAGHGISVAGSNYLLPVKSGYNPSMVDETGLRLLAETKLFNAEQAVAEMSNAAVKCNIVILDACRTTPVARNPATRDATKSGGLVEMNPPAGSLIAFATDAGHAALDGTGSNGLYTQELIEHLVTPGLTIEQVFKRTRAGVMERSEGKQIPAEYSRLVGDDIFLAGPTPGPLEDVIPKGKPVPIPTLIEITRLAEAGNVRQCIEAIQQFTRNYGKSGKIAAPLLTLLDAVKEDLRDPKTAASRAEPALRSCDLILPAVNDCLPSEHEQLSMIAAKAHNRRGDALLLLGRNQEALESFNKALTLTPTDAYIFYNRGRAMLALDRRDEAHADFTAAADAKLKQPGARKLAREALGAMQ